MLNLNEHVMTSNFKVAKCELLIKKPFLVHLQFKTKKKMNQAIFVRRKINQLMPYLWMKRLNGWVVSTMVWLELCDQTKEKSTTKLRRMLEIWFRLIFAKNLLKTNLSQIIWDRIIEHTNVECHYRNMTTRRQWSGFPLKMNFLIDSDELFYVSHECIVRRLPQNWLEYFDYASKQSR